MDYYSNVKRKKTKSGAENSDRLRKAVIYVRVSDVKQVDGVSLDSQEKEVRSFLQNSVDENGKPISYEVVKVFREEGRSGKDQYRGQFQEMIEYVRNHQHDIDGVCFYAISRLGRNVRMVLETIDYFNKLNVAVLSKTDNLNSKTANGRFTLTILSALAQLESEQIAERVMPNMKYSVENLGRWQGARYVPYGYDHEKDPDDPKGERKRLVINPEEAKQVKQIFEWFCYGIVADLNVGEFKIAKHLNKIGWKYRHGKEWHVRQIQSIIQNGHLYAGWLVWNRHGTENKTVEVTDERGIVKDVEVMNYKHGFPKPVKVTYRKEDHEVVSGQGNHEPIITEQIWERCRERLIERSKKDRRNRDTSRQAKHLFTHVLRCPQCDGAMSASTLKGVVYYKCYRAAKGGQCNHNLIQENFIREPVLDVLLTHFEFHIYRRFDEIVSEEAMRDEYQTAVEAELSSLHIKLERANKRMADVVHEYQSDAPNKLIRTREQASAIIGQIESERIEVEKRIEELSSTLQEKQLEQYQVKQIVEKLKDFSNIREYFDSLSPEGKMDFVDRYIVRIDYSKEASKKGAHAYRIMKIVLATEFYNLFDTDDGDTDARIEKLAELVRKGVGGAVSKERSNLNNVIKIFAQRVNLPIYYTNHLGEETVQQNTLGSPMQYARVFDLLHTMNSNAKKEFTQLLKSLDQETPVTFEGKEE
jgi:site-specific DNA recombinase